MTNVGSKKRFASLLLTAGLLASACTSTTPTPGVGGSAPAGSAPAVVGSTQPAPASATTGKTELKVIEQEPSSLDPDIVVDFSTYTIDQLFEPMYILKTDGSIDYRGAKSVDVSPDGLTWTFTLNPAYKWSDGQPVTAADYEYSWKRILDPKTAGQGAGFLFDIKGAQDYNSGKITDPSQVGITATDTYTLQVTMAHPAPWFKAVVALPYFPPVPKAVVEQYGDQWTDPSHIATNGPYKLTAWDHGSQIVLDKNPDYGGPAPSITHVVLSITSSDPCTAQLRAYETSEVDLATCIPPTDIARVQSDPTLSKQLVIHPLSGTVYVQFDNSKPPFNDVRVRQALAMVVDRKSIVDAITQGTAKVAPVLVPTDIPGNNPADAFQGSLDQAKQLLAAAGFPNGQGFPKFQLMASSARSQQQIAEILQQTWSQTLGINAQVTVLEENAYRAWVAQRATQPYDAVIEQWYSDYSDPQDWYDQIWGTPDVRHNHYSDPAFLQLLQQANAESDPQQRVAIYKQANAILEKDQPSIPLYYPVDLYLVKPGLTGLFIDQGTIDLWYYGAATYNP